MLEGRKETHYTDIFYLEAEERIMPLTTAGITMVLFICLANDLFLVTFDEQLTGAG